MFAIEITTETGPVIVRFRETLREARKTAALWPVAKWQTRIMMGGAGGMEVK